jgi:galactarate dehydratase
MDNAPRPLAIRMHADDNVAIIANDGGLVAGTVMPAGPAEGLVLRDRVPQGHKVALRDIAAGDAVRRYGVPVGLAREPITAGRWVHERLLDIPPARVLEGLPMATRPAPVLPALDGFTFEGFVNPDGTVGTRNLLAVTTTVQCVAGVVGQAVERIRRELLPQFPNVDGVLGLEHSYGCGVAIDAPQPTFPSARCATSA